MSHEVRKDAELLNHLLDACPAVMDRQTGRQALLTAKQLAHWTDLSIQAVSDYRTGKTRIPFEFWRHVLEHYVDRRIVALVIPDDLGFELYDVRCNCPASGREFFRDAIDAEILYHEQMKAVAELLADGRIDEFDAATVQKYDDAFHEHRLRDAALHHAVVNTFHRNLEKKALTRD